MAHYPEYQRDELRSAMTSIISRYETAEALELSGHLWKGPAQAMLLDAVQALAAAFPDDRFYQDRADRLRRLSGGRGERWRLIRPSTR